MAEKTKIKIVCGDLSVELGGTSTLSELLADAMWWMNEGGDELLSIQELAISLNLLIAKIDKDSWFGGENIDPRDVRVLQELENLSTCLLNFNKACKAAGV